LFFAGVNEKCSDINGVCISSKKCYKAGGQIKKNLCSGGNKKDVQCCTNLKCKIKGVKGECM